MTSAIFLQQLYSASRMSSKTNTTIDWDVSVDGGNAAIEPVTADGANTATDNTVPANLRIGRYRIKHQFSLSRVDLSEAASRAPQELQNLFNAHVDRGLNHLLRSLNQLLFTGDGTAASGEVVGLSKILDNSYAYANISPVAYPAWQTIKSTGTPAGTNRALTKNILLKHDELTKIQETSWDMIICNPAMGTTYNQLFDGIGGGMVVVKGDQGALQGVELGHGVRTYMGRPIIEDPMCPGNQLIFMQSSDLELFTFDLSTNPSPMSQVERSVASTKAWGLIINVAELPSNNSAKRTFELYVLPQFRVYNRKSIQVIADLT